MEIFEGLIPCGPLFPCCGSTQMSEQVHVTQPRRRVRVAPSLSAVARQAMPRAFSGGYKKLLCPSSGVLASLYTQLHRCPFS